MSIPTDLEAGSPKPAYIDINGAADHFAVSVWTVRRWIKQGILTAVALPGGMIRIPISALDSIVEPIGA